MSEERAKRLAMILQAIDDSERQFAEVRTDFKNRLQTLQNQSWALRQSILSGQAELPLEPSV